MQVLTVPSGTSASVAIKTKQEHQSPFSPQFSGAIAPCLKLKMICLVTPCFFSSQRYTELVHYYTYEWSSFIADVGGFLGLLLGYSVLSIYDEAKILLKAKKYQQFFTGKI